MAINYGNLVIGICQISICKICHLLRAYRPIGLKVCYAFFSGTTGDLRQFLGRLKEIVLILYKNTYCSTHFLLVNKECMVCHPKLAP